MPRNAHFGYRWRRLITVAAVVPSISTLAQRPTVSLAPSTTHPGHLTWTLARPELCRAQALDQGVTIVLELTLAGQRRLASFTDGPEISGPVKYRSWVRNLCAHPLDAEAEGVLQHWVGNALAARIPYLACSPAADGTWHCVLAEHQRSELRRSLRTAINTLHSQVVRSPYQLSHHLARVERLLQTGELSADAFPAQRLSLATLWQAQRLMILSREARSLTLTGRFSLGLTPSPEASHLYLVEISPTPQSRAQTSALLRKQLSQSLPSGPLLCSLSGFDPVLRDMELSAERSPFCAPPPSPRPGVGPDELLSGDLFDLVMGQSRFVMNNRRAKVLTLPPGSYTYQVFPLLSGRQRWDRSAYHTPIATGTLLWSRGRNQVAIRTERTRG